MIVIYSLLQLIYPEKKEEGCDTKINTGTNIWLWYTHLYTITRWESSLKAAVGNTVGLSVKQKQKINQMWLY